MLQKTAGPVRTSLTIGLAVLFTTGASLAEPSVDVRAGVHSENGDALLGGGLLTSIGESKHWYLNPNLEYVFASSADQWQVNMDVHYDVVEGRPYYVWFGGGPALLHYNADSPGSNRNDVGVNLIAGMAFRQPEVTPFFQGRVTLADDSAAVLAFGVRF